MKDGLVDLFNEIFKNKFSSKTLGKIHLKTDLAWSQYMTGRSPKENTRGNN